MICRWDGKPSGPGASVALGGAGGGMAALGSGVTDTAETWEAVDTCSTLGTVVVAAVSAATVPHASAAAVLAGIAAIASAAAVLAGFAAIASAAAALDGIAAVASAAAVLVGIAAVASAAAVLVGFGATASAATALAGFATTASAATVLAGTGATASAAAASAAAVLVGFAGAAELSLEFTASTGMPTVSQGACLVDSSCCLCGAWVGTGMAEGLGLAAMATWDAAAGLGSSCLQAGFASIFGTAGGPANTAVGAHLGTGACICGGMAAALQGVGGTGTGEMGSGLAGQLLFKAVGHGTAEGSALVCLRNLESSRIGTQIMNLPSACLVWPFVINSCSVAANCSSKFSF